MWFSVVLQWEVKFVVQCGDTMGGKMPLNKVFLLFP